MILVVIYVNVEQMNVSQKQEIFAEFNSRFKQDKKIRHYIMPITEGENRIECINPKYISDKDQPELYKLRKLLEKTQDMFLELMDELEERRDQNFTTRVADRPFEIKDESSISETKESDEIPFLVKKK